MINFVVAYDNIDTKLGMYFEECKNQLLGLLEEHNELVNGNVCEIAGRQCNNAYIDIMIPKYNTNPFVFIAYSHGNEKALCCNANFYVDKNVNARHFVNSLFYTTACSAGKELGSYLVDSGCLAFVGYKNDINVYIKTDKKDISKNCDNAGIVAFLSENITILEACKKMKTYYTQQIDKLENMKDMIFAGELVEARDALICLGNENLKKEDLFVT
ncbi:hypothetical protein AGMMS4956_20290 [Bacteroidia bacterium]|nr:hypothetical protein AGMMS4956_20290 [Bacteroidia bacterium]